MSPKILNFRKDQGFPKRPFQKIIGLQYYKLKLILGIVELTIKSKLKTKNLGNYLKIVRAATL